MLIIQCEVILASKNLVDSKSALSTAKGSGGSKKQSKSFKEKNSIDQEYQNDVDYEYKNITDFFIYPTHEKGVGETPWKPGPMKTISDSVFCLIILIYVIVIFVFMFFAFCWNTSAPPPSDPAHKTFLCQFLNFYA